MGQQLAAPDTCDCNTLEDNSVMLSWDFTVPANGSTNVSWLTTFSPLGLSPLSTTKTADAATAAPGSGDGYTITIHNPNTSAVTVNSITDTLPAGFTYTAGSTTGATTSDPSIAGQQLTWTGPFSAPANGDLTLHFGVTVSSTPGMYFNNAGGDAGSVAVAPTGDTAPVTVTGTLQHGIGFTKGCDSPTKVGDPYTCTYTIRNNVDDALDTLTFNQIVDTVHAASGNVVDPFVLDQSTVAVQGGASCTSPPNRVCTVPPGGRVDVGPLSFYTVQPADFTSANPLTDDATLFWHDLCNGTPSSNCNPNPPPNGAASQSIITKRTSQTATTIHDASHNTVTIAETGLTVHDFVTVTGEPGAANPTGNVTIDFFTNNQCTGPPASTSPPIALDAAGHADALSFPQGPLAAGFYGFVAHYPGDGTYTGSDGQCEPLQVVDAYIQISPP